MFEMISLNNLDSGLYRQNLHHKKKQLFALNCTEVKIMPNQIINSKMYSKIATLYVCVG